MHSEPHLFSTLERKSWFLFLPLGLRLLCTRVVALDWKIAAQYTASIRILVIGEDFIIIMPVKLEDWLHICFTILFQDVGCDGILGSKKKEDKCLRCLSPDESASLCQRVNVNVTYSSNSIVGELIHKLQARLLLHYQLYWIQTQCGYSPNDASEIDRVWKGRHLCTLPITSSACMQWCFYNVVMHNMFYYYKNVRHQVPFNIRWLPFHTLSISRWISISFHYMSVSHRMSTKVHTWELISGNID